MIIKRDFNYINGANRSLHIYLPDDYHETSIKYSVMYFFDGHNLFLDSDATYGKSWGLKDFMDSWQKDLIIVGIECGHNGDERLSEYLPYPAEKGSWIKGHEPMGELTLNWVINDIKPYIDSELRTIPFRECTAIGGSSMGGIMALYAAVKYNRWFSKAACLSSSIGPCMSSLMKDINVTPLNPDTRIYLSWGTYEAYRLKNREQEDTESLTYKDNKLVADTLRIKGVFVRMFCQVGGGHSEASWERLVPDFMSFLWLK